jgi:hypothetical protein
MFLLCTLNPCKRTATASNNTTFSTHSINAIKSAYANLAMAMSYCWIASKLLQFIHFETAIQCYNLNKIFCTCYVIEM